MQYSLSAIYALDKSLSGIEKRYLSKLDKYYSDFERSALQQATRYRDDKSKKGIKLPDAKREGLNKNLKSYFRDIEKAGTDSVKKELLSHAKTAQEKAILLDLKAPKSNKANNKWAEELAKRQAKGYEQSVTKALNEAIKANPKITTQELKELIKRKTEAFKGARLDNTIQNESNRIQNQVRIEAYRSSGMVRAVIFIATIDNRTTQNCMRKHNTVIALDDSRISNYYCPNHPRCRSYLNYVLISDKKTKLTSSASIDNLIKNNPIQTLKGMPKAA